MKIVSVNSPESLYRWLEENSRCAGINRPEHIRLAVREQIRTEILFSEKLEEEPEQNKISRFFDYCINCGKRLDFPARKNHFFHKNIEVFKLQFCCFCYEQFKDKSLNEFPVELIDNIQKKIKAYKT